jgi:hypothetical protein
MKWKIDLSFYQIEDASKRYQLSEEQSTVFNYRRNQRKVKPH